MCPETPIFSFGGPFSENPATSINLKLLNSDRKNRSLAAILFADMVGFTRLMNEDEQSTIVLSEKLRDTIEKQVAKFRGKLFQYTGDGCLSVFRSAIDAVRCGIAIQQKLQKAPTVPVRIGIHLGEVMFYRKSIYGSSVNIASRIESFGTPGSVLISKKVNEEMANQSNIKAISLGHFELKNVDHEVEIFAISARGLHLPHPKELEGKGHTSQYSIGVLPFRTGSDEESQDFAVGIAEELLHSLAGVHGLSVASQTSCFSYKNKGLLVHTIAEELGVTHLLEGGVRRNNGQMRASLQLIDCSSGFQVWSDTFEIKVKNRFAAEVSLAKSITKQVVKALGMGHAIEYKKALRQNSKSLMGYFMEKWSNLFKIGKVEIPAGMRPDLSDL